MTTTIAVETPTGVVLGADSLISSFDDDGQVMSVSVLPQPTMKIVECGDYAIGVAGDTRGQNLLAHCFNPPPFNPLMTRSDTDRWLTTLLIPALKELLEEHDYAIGGVSDKSASHNSQFLVATRFHAYIVESDYGWAADRSGLYAIGTGSQFALGALHASKGKKPLSMEVAEKRIIEALSVAAALDPYTGGPFRTIRVGAD